MHAQFPELWGGAEGGRELREPIAIRPDARFRILADGPNAGSAELLGRSRVDAGSWILVADATGQPIAADITADAGGHMCLNGVGFNLAPRAPLAPGAYTLALLIDGVRWPVLDSDQRGAFRGAPALVRHYVVTSATPP